MNRLILALAVPTLILAQTSPFPASLDTDVTLGVAANRVDTRLSASMTAAATSFTVASAARIVANVPLVIGSGASPEYVWVCGVSSTTISVGKASCPNADGRGIDGTTAASHVSSETVKGLPIAWQFNAANSAIKAIETALGANLANALSGEIVAAAYNFTAYGCNSSLVCTPGATSSGASLIVGNNTLTMTPVPFGVAGTHTVAASLPHLLYVSGGTGTAEACPISGGGGTSGAASGTIIINCANTHSGAFTVKSNTSGAQEAIYVAGSSGIVKLTGAINLWQNTSTLAALTLPGYCISMFGGDVGTTTVLANGTTGKWIESTAGAAGCVSLGGFTIGNATGTTHTTGSLIYLGSLSYGTLRDVYASNCYDCITLDFTNSAFSLRNISASGSRYGLYATGTQTMFNLTGFNIHGGVAGIRIDNTTTTGVFISNGLLDASFGTTASAALSIVEAVGQQINEIQISNVDLESGTGFGAQITGNAAFANGAILLENVHANASVAALSIVDTNGILVKNLHGVITGASKVAPIVITNSRLIDIEGATLLSDATATNGVVVSGTTNEDIRLSNITIGRGAGATAPTNGINITNGSRVQISGGDINATNPLVITTSANVRRSNVGGVENVIPTVASSATIAIPVNDSFILSGNTGVGTVSYPLIAGSTFSFTASHASPGAWTAGATIGNTFTPTQNQPVFCSWDGAKVYCNP